MKTAGLFLVAFFGIIFGLYPFLYVLTDMSQGFPSTKSAATLELPLWHIAFYLHIIPGAIGMLTGWVQFFSKIRNRHLSLHRLLGKIYVISCLIAGVAGLFLAVYANGGLISSLGFGGLAICWLIATSRAYVLIRSGNSEAHREWMTRSYALTFAAVMLRLWIPVIQLTTGLDFSTTYIIVSWLCWVPNIIGAELIIRQTGYSSQYRAA